MTMTETEYHTALRAFSDCYTSPSATVRKARMLNAFQAILPPNAHRLSAKAVDKLISKYLEESRP
jgi:hypothetical protein